MDGAGDGNADAVGNGKVEPLEGPLFTGEAGFFVMKRVFRVYNEKSVKGVDR